MKLLKTKATGYDHTQPRDLTSSLNPAGYCESDTKVALFTNGAISFAQYSSMTRGY
tara:strand:- start:538 stop:705 length:168 start_codon:yes stop_codon:yes gene_type:complete